MSETIDAVPPDRLHEAIDLLVSKMPSQTAAQQRFLLWRAISDDPAQQAGWLGHFREGVLDGVCWLQLQPGRVGALWPPVLSRHANQAVACALIGKAIELAARQSLTMVQSLVTTDSGVEASLLAKAGFAHVADLLYLVSAADSFPSSRPASDLRYITAADIGDVDDWRARLEPLIERTYAGTRDCPALNGVRAISDVLNGYREVGKYRPDLWLVARVGEDDLGCALLADHAPERVWELMYMGIAPEARGKGWGLEMVRYLQWLASREQVERFVLAVDAANQPAIDLYAAAGFVGWDRRSVFVYFLTRRGGL